MSSRRVFPPALVPVLRRRCQAADGKLSEVGDVQLGELLTTVYFAGLETYEGEHGAIRVVFVGTSHADVVLPEGSEPGPTGYAWKILRFERARPFAIPELVKLAVASAPDRMFIAVALEEPDRLAIAGLARSGLTSDADPFLEIVAPNPGSLTVSSGNQVLLDYERGTIISERGDVLRVGAPVRRALEAAARAADVEPDAWHDYLRVVEALIVELARHGRGGILVISSDDAPQVATAASYRMAGDSSIAALLRLSRRIRSTDGASYGALLRAAFLAEIDHMVEEFGALTAIDGATVLTCELALAAFGVVLPVGPAIELAAAPAGGQELDLGTRGTRHRASATYARDHPGSVVFVASEDGQLRCMLREPGGERVVVWQLGSTVRHLA
jgi:hypothetical protein